MLARGRSFLRPPCYRVQYQDTLSPEGWLCMTSGSVEFRTQSPVTTTLLMVGSEGTVYMMSVIIFSITLRRPRAPIFSSMALSAMAPSASSSKTSSTPS